MNIFAYLKTAEISQQDLDEIRKAGMIPVAVDSFDDVKVMETLPEGEYQALLSSALKAIKQSAYGSTRESFASALLNQIT